MDRILRRGISSFFNSHCRNIGYWMGGSKERSKAADYQKALTDYWQQSIANQTAQIRALEDIATEIMSK